MFCNKCGLAIPDDSINCPNCGKPAVSDQPEILQTPYFKTPLNTNNNSSYARGDYYNLNTYLKDVAEHRSMPIAAPLSASISHDNKMTEAADKNEPSSNRPLYIAIIAMISLIVIAIISLILRLTVLKSIENRSDTTSAVVSSYIIEEPCYAYQL